jgi:hypothetical protein
METLFEAPAPITLEVHNCKARRSILVGFASEEQALEFCQARRSTHAVYEVETLPVDDKFSALIDYLYPTCPHGMSESLCADPINHYPA